MEKNAKDSRLKDSNKERDPTSAYDVAQLLRERSVSFLRTAFLMCKEDWYQATLLLKRSTTKEFYDGLVTLLLLNEEREAELEKSKK